MGSAAYISMPSGRGTRGSPGSAAILSPVGESVPLACEAEAASSLIYMLCFSILSHHLSESVLAKALLIPSLDDFSRSFYAIKYCHFAFMPLYAR
jgi:hypothetical protein